MQAKLVGAFTASMVQRDLVYAEEKSSNAYYDQY